MLAAYFVPPYFARHGHRPPVGTYVALVGLFAAAATFRKEPPGLEKALWIGLITLLTVREIRNLYVADREQADTFGKIQISLNETKNGLDTTLTRISSATSALQGMSGEIDDARTKSEAQFASTISRVNESIKMETGGDSFCYLTAAAPSERGLGVSILSEGNYPLYQVQVRVADAKYMHATGEVMSATVFTDTIGDIFPPHSGIFFPIKQFKYHIPGPHQALNIFFSAKNGFWTELLRLEEVNNKWVFAIMVIRHNDNYSHGAVVKKIVSPDFPPTILAKDESWTNFDKLSKTVR